MIDPTHRRKLYQYVVEELGQRIVRGRYLPGDTLPNEDALCQEFGVSRGVLREAAKVLSEKGLIRSRPKTGTQILARKDWNLFDPDVLSWTCQAGSPYEFLRNITEIRRIVEAEAARMAAQRAKPETIRPIEDAFGAMDALMKNPETFSSDRFIELDLQFHAEILEACGNELLAQISHTMAQALRTGRQVDRPDYEACQASVQAHREILAHIRNRQPDRAHQAALDHLNQVLKEMAGRFEQRGGEEG